MNKQKLLDNYEDAGTNYEEMKEKIKCLGERTNLIKVRPRDITILSLCQIKKLQKPGMAVFYILSYDYLQDFIEYGQNFRIGSIPISDIGEELYEEMVATTGMMFVIDNQKFLLSKSAMLTFCQQANVSGDRTTKRANVCRDLHIADSFFQRVRNVSIVYRTVDGLNKIFAIFSSSHIHTGNDFIINAVENDDTKQNMKKAFGNSDFKVEYYNITNTVTEFGISFTKEKIRPGLIFMDSDTGHASITVKSAMFIEGEYVVIKEYLMKHSAKTNLEEFCKMVNQAIVDVNQSSFQEKMNNVLNCTIALTKSDLNKIINNVMQDVLSKKKKIYLKDMIVSKYDTLYVKDVALEIVKVNNYLNDLHKEKVDDIRRCTYCVPDIIKQISY